MGRELGWGGIRERRLVTSDFRVWNICSGNGDRKGMEWMGGDGKGWEGWSWDGRGLEMGNEEWECHVLVRGWLELDGVDVGWFVDR